MICGIGIIGSQASIGTMDAEQEDSNMEYFGTIFVAVICFVLGYVLGRIKWKQEYKKRYSDGSWDGMAKYLERYWEWANKQKENETE